MSKGGESCIISAVERVFSRVKELRSWITSILLENIVNIPLACYYSFLRDKNLKRVVGKSALSRHPRGNYGRA